MTFKAWVKHGNWYLVEADKHLVGESRKEGLFLVVWENEQFFFFFNFYLAVPRPTLDDSQGDSITNLMLIAVFLHVRPECHREPRNEVGSLSPVELPAGFELGTFQFWFQRLNPLGHFPLKYLARAGLLLIPCPSRESTAIWSQFGLKLQNLTSHDSL